MDISWRCLPAQADLLRHISQATETWARAERPARSFLLVESWCSSINHRPPWLGLPSWPTPSEHTSTIWQNSPGSGGTIGYSSSGACGVREARRGGRGAHSHPGRPLPSRRPAIARAPYIPALFVSWAHDSPEWRRRSTPSSGAHGNGIAAEIDLLGASCQKPAGPL